MDLPSSTARRRLTQMHQVQENLLRANQQQLSKAERAFQRSFSRECTDLRRKWLSGGENAAPGSHPDSPVPSAGPVSGSPPLRRTKSVFQFSDPAFPPPMDATSSPSDSELSLEIAGRQQRSRQLPARAFSDDADGDVPLKVGSLDRDSELPQGMGSGELGPPGPDGGEEDEEEAWKREIRRRRQERDVGRRQASDHVAALLGGCQLRTQRAPIPVTRVKSLPSYMLSTASTRSKKLSDSRKASTDSP